MNLGICYLKGIGMKRDLEKAMDYLSRAAKKGNLEAKLQYCYYLL
jgi:TPR repeat protein